MKDDIDAKKIIHHWTTKEILHGSSIDCRWQCPTRKWLGCTHPSRYNTLSPIPMCDENKCTIKDE